MKKKTVRKYIILAILVVIWLVFRNFPAFTESIYSCGIYPFIAKIQHFLWGWLPFSFGDVFYTILLFAIILGTVKYIRKLWQEPLKALDKLFTKLIRLVFAFFMLWGFNYFRIPLAESLHIDRKYTEEQLLKATENCIARANALHSKLAANDSTKVDFWLSQSEIYRIAATAYPLNRQGITDFKAIESVKPSLYSKLLTYMGYSGYLNPFTNEAQVNGLMVGYSTPITACHEIAHQMGYAAEQEANYLGYLAAEKVQNPYFNYSAELFALRYFLGEVAMVAPQHYEELRAKVHKGIFENYKEVRLFWEQYKNKAEPVFKSSYNVFLKVNKQRAGINSYDLVVGLLISHYTS